MQIRVSAKMTRIQTLAGLALVFWTGLAAPATWVEIGGNEEVTVSIDSDSIRKSGSLVKSWLKWNWAKPQEVPNSYPVKMYLSEKQLQVSDCRNNTLAIAQGVRYATADGATVTDSYTVDEKYWKFSDTIPETMGETIVLFSCKKVGALKK